MDRDISGKFFPPPPSSSFHLMPQKELRGHFKANEIRKPCGLPHISNGTIAATFIPVNKQSQQLLHVSLQVTLTTSLWQRSVTTLQSSSTSSRQPGQERKTRRDSIQRPAERQFKRRRKAVTIKKIALYRQETQEDAISRMLEDARRRID